VPLPMETPRAVETYLAKERIRRNSMPPAPAPPGDRESITGTPDNRRHSDFLFGQVIKGFDIEMYRQQHEPVANCEPANESEGLVGWLASMTTWRDTKGASPA